MSMTANIPQHAVTRRKKDGLLGLWGRVVHRNQESYERWLEERDLTLITASLLRLNERQLNRLGFSHATLALDVEDLAARARREAQLAHEVLRIVEGDDSDADAGESRHAVAAE